MKRLSLVLVMSWMAYGASPCGQPGVIFCNGFEGTQSEIQEAWGNSTAPQFAVSDPGPFGVTGNKVLRLDNEIMTHVRRGLGAGYDRVYARWYQKFSDDYNWNYSHHHGFTFSSSTESGASAYYPDGCTLTNWIQLEPNRVPDMSANGLHWYVYHPGKDYGYSDKELWNPWGDIFGTGTSVFTNGTWHCIEAMIDLGTPTPTKAGANGVLDVWVDGTHYGPNTCGPAPLGCGGIWFRTCSALQIKYVDIMSSAPGWPGDVNAIYYDDVVVSTQPIGVGTRVEYAPVPIRVASDTLPNAKKDSAYSFFLVGAGGAKPYTWQLASGTLPTGISLNGITGNLKGPPTVSGSFTFTIRITGSGASQTAEKTFTLLIKSSGNPGITMLGNNPAQLAKVEGSVQSGRLLLRFPAAGNAGIVRLFDAMGHTVWSKGMKAGAVSVESPVLSNGLYVGQIRNSRESVSFRFAVVR